MFLETWLILEILGLAILAVAGLYIYYKYYVFEFWNKKGVFTVEPTFLVGNMMPILSGKTSHGDFFRDMYEQNKKHSLLGVYMLHKPHLMVNDLNLVKELLTKNFSSFHDRGVFFNEKTDPLSGNLFQMPGKKWRNLRVKLTPTFTSGKIKQMFPTLQELSDRLCKYLDEKAELKESIDVKDVFERYTVDIIISVAFGISCDSFENPNNEFRSWGKKIFEPRIVWNTLIFWAPQVLDFFSLPYTDRGVTKFFTTMFRDTVEYREANNIVRKDFLNLLMQLMRNGYLDPDEDAKTEAEAKMDNNKLELLQAAAQAYVFYIGGFETSSTTITYCMYELAKHQNIQDKLRNEIQTVIKQHGGFTYNAVNDMPYLHKVVSETLRKYPPIGTLNRVCTKEQWIDEEGVTVPLGMPVIIPVFGIHRDPDIYPEPEKFDPERFSEENIKARHSYAYLPFGEGPRICIGSRFGLLQVKIAVINTLLKHRVKPTPNTPDTLEYETGSIVLLPKGGVHLNIERCVS